MQMNEGEYRFLQSCSPHLFEKFKRYCLEMETHPRMSELVDAMDKYYSIWQRTDPFNAYAHFTGQLLELMFDVYPDFGGVIEFASNEADYESVRDEWLKRMWVNLGGDRRACA